MCYFCHWGLRAAKIIGLENINNIIRWNLVYAEHNTPAYEVDTNWWGIHEHCRIDRRRCPNFNSLSKKKTEQKEKKTAKRAAKNK